MITDPRIKITGPQVNWDNWPAGEDNWPAGEDNWPAGKNNWLPGKDYYYHYLLLLRTTEPAGKNNWPAGENNWPRDERVNANTLAFKLATSSVRSSLSLLRATFSELVESWCPSTSFSSLRSWVRLKLAAKKERQYLLQLTSTRENNTVVKLK